MLKTIDSLFGWLLVLGACGHTVGTILWTQPMSGIFLWSLGSALAALLLGVLNIVRAARPPDRTLALITLIGCVCWALLALAFGKSIGNMLDPRPLFHALISIGLIVFSAMTIRRSPRR